MQELWQRNVTNAETYSGDSRAISSGNGSAAFVPGFSFPFLTSSESGEAIRVAAAGALTGPLLVCGFISHVRVWL